MHGQQGGIYIYGKFILFTKKITNVNEVMYFVTQGLVFGPIVGLRL